MQDSTFIGLYVHKATISVAVARDERGGEVRHWGTLPHQPDHVRKLTVHGIYPGPIDTELARDIPLSKTSAGHCAAEIVKALERGDLHIFPDPTSAQLSALWLATGPQLEAALR